jgi:nitronate monooxygenase
VQLGTAFLRCEEANIGDAYRQAVAGADDACTVVSDVITGRPARFIRNRLIDDLLASGLETLPFPAQGGVVAPLTASNDPQEMALFCGQAAAIAKDTTASELVSELAIEISRRLPA